MEKSVAPAGFDPATAGLWAQHANHCATVLPVLIAFLRLSQCRKYFSTSCEIFIPSIKLLHIWEGFHFVSRKCDAFITTQFLNLHLALHLFYHVEQYTKQSIKIPFSTFQGETVPY